MNDYISRAAAVEKITFLCELREIVCNPDDEFLRGLKNALNAVKSNEVIPSADVQPISQWISVDEALPEKDGYYLVVTQGIHNPTIDIAGFWHYAEWVQKEIRENYWNKYDKVLYWQPLPELPEAI